MKIRSIGTALPSTSISQEVIAGKFIRALELPERRAHALKTLFRMTDIESRSTVLSEQEQETLLSIYKESPTGMRMKWYERYAPILAQSAALDAFRKSTTIPKEVTHLITVSCTGFFAPGLDILLVTSLGLSLNVSRTHIGFQGCHGAFNALKVAKAFIAENPNAIILVVCVELCSLHLNVNGDTIANSLFGDGAAAVICTSSGEEFQLTLESSSSTLMEDSCEYMSWKIGDAGFSMTLSPKLPELIIRSLAEMVDSFLSDTHYSRSDINGYVIHPGGPRILSACQTALNLTDSALRCSQDVLRQHGNMSSPTILFVLDKMIKSEIPRPYLAVGFGPGISTELILLT